MALGLATRNALKKTRLMVMPVAAKMRFGGLNVLLHWAAYLIIVIMTVTGIFLYLGQGGWLIQVHSYVAFVGLGYVLSTSSRTICRAAGGRCSASSVPRSWCSPRP